MICICWCTRTFLYIEKCRKHISTVFPESLLHECRSAPVCLFMLCVRAVYCVKSLAGASSQPGGQTRKQMDWFGLNPSHAILSSWPSSSLLPSLLPSLPPHPTCSPRSAKWKQGSNRVLCCSSGGGEPRLMLLVPRRDGQKTESNLTLPCVSWPVLTHGLCLHVWTLTLLSRFAVSLPLLFYFHLPRRSPLLGLSV